MLIIKTYTCRNTGKVTHTLKVVHNNKILNQYRKVSSEVLETLMSDFDNHKLVENINVAKLSDL